MKLVYADEMAISALMRVEDGEKPTKAEAALLEASGLLDTVGVNREPSVRQRARDEEPAVPIEDTQSHTLPTEWPYIDKRSGLPDFRGLRHKSSSPTTT